MNYQEEQETELETLGYIFPEEEFDIVSRDPIIVQIYVTLDDPTLMDRLVLHEPEAEEPSFTLNFELGSEYPETLPGFSILDAISLEQEECQILVEQGLQHGNESLGMAMIYTIASFVKEKAQDVILERIDRQEQERERLAKKQEEEEAIRYQGTRVTPESFKSWQDAFIQESIKLAASGVKLSLAMEAALAVHNMGLPKVGQKLTGRQLFEKDLTLAKSDMQYVEEGDVAVDVSLFEGMEHLDLDEEDENQVLAGLTED